MINETIRTEKHAFWISFLGTTSLSIIGFVVFFVTKSQIVLLDSLFSLITAADALISVWVVSVSAKNHSDNYPFGLMQARPMLALFNGVIILAFIFTAIFNPPSIISSGGNILPGKIIALYAFLSVAVSLAVSRFLYQKCKQTNSSLIRLEMIQWIQALLISLSVGVVFGCSVLINHPLISYINPYLDTVMVMLIGTLFVPSVVREIKSSGKQLLLSAPPEDIKQRITAYVSEICQQHHMQARNVYMILSSELLYVDIELLVIDQSWDWEQVNRIRNDTDTHLMSMHRDVCVAVSFYDINNENAAQRHTGPAAEMRPL